MATTADAALERAPGPTGREAGPSRAAVANRPDKEKELRLAVVCYGGVSLAVYEHGIVKEILHLVRASKILHTASGVAPGGFDPSLDPDSKYSTAGIYLEALETFRTGVDLRVVVDVIAGSSAGGINGVVLARAIAHDLSMDPVTSMWLADADIVRLLAPEAKAGPWSKWYLRPVLGPLLWVSKRRGEPPVGLDREAKRALSVFLRSRWFQPPLNGRLLTRLLLDGLNAMGESRARSASLLPTGNRLDLVVTATDFHGPTRLIFLHDPAFVRENEHHLLFRFAYERPLDHVEFGSIQSKLKNVMYSNHLERVSGGRPVPTFPQPALDGATKSDFDTGGVPALAFAARATSAYPGAFPPAQLREMDAVLAERGETWPGRRQFVESNFRHYREVGADPEGAVLLDGSILNNKPVIEAIRAIRQHRALREVDRRLIYIDPHPFRAEQAAEGREPGFFTTLRRALSDLPRDEPIFDEIAELDAFNEKIRRARAALHAVRDQGVFLVEKMTGGRLRRRVSADEVRRWRLNSGNMLPRLVYNAWIGQLLSEATDFITRLVLMVCGYPQGSRQARWVAEVISAWSRKTGVLSENYVMPSGVRSEADLPPFGEFIVSFGVKYRRRRLTLVIQAVSEMYHRLSEPRFARASSGELDRLKHRLYQCLDDLRIYDSAEFLSAAMRSQICSAFKAARPEAASDPDQFVADHLATMSQLFNRLRQECSLFAANENVDAVLASPEVFQMGAAVQEELLIRYIGFIFWDLVLLPMTSSLDLDVGTLEEILVDRISPEDASTLQPPSGQAAVQGGSLAGFGGFFSRTVRESDYLWGRIHAIDRLFDLLASTADSHLGYEKPDMLAFKKRAFETVLNAEAGRLTSIRPLIAHLQASVAAL